MLKSCNRPFVTTLELNVAIGRKTCRENYGKNMTVTIMLTLMSEIFSSILTRVLLSLNNRPQCYEKSAGRFVNGS